MNVKGRTAWHVTASLALLPTLCLGTTTQPAVPHDATHKEVESIGLTPETRFERLGTVLSKWGKRDRVNIAVNSHGNRIFVQDVKKNIIRVLANKGGSGS